MFDRIRKTISGEHLASGQENILYKSLFENSHSVMLVIHPETGRIIDANNSACTYYMIPKQKITSMNISDINIMEPAKVFDEMGKAKEEKRCYFNFTHRLSNGETREVEVYSNPVKIEGHRVLFSVIHDISEKKKREREKDELIQKLEKALYEIKALKEILPICSSCKKIRDDEGYWNQLETYIRDHYEVEFSHSMCPECTKKNYPDFF